LATPHFVWAGLRCILEGLARKTEGRLYGRLEVGEDSRLRIHGSNGKSMASGNGAQPAMILNRGVVTWQGSAMGGWDASRLVNEGRWELEQDGEIMGYCCGGGPATLINHGVLAKTGGTGVTTLDTVNLDQRGVVSAASGVLQLSYHSSWAAGSRVEGLGTVALTGGNMTAAGLVTLSVPLEVAGANLVGDLAVVGSAPLRWKAGRRYAFYSVATDKAGNREEAPLQPDAVTRVNLANVAPTIAAVDPVSVDEGSPVTVQLSGNDPDLPSQTLTWSLGSEAPAGVVIEPATGRLTWETGEGNGPSVVEFRVMVRDNGVPALSATNTVRITVREVNRAPVLLDVADRQVNEGQVLSFALAAVDADRPSQSLTFRLEGTVPAGMTVNPLTGVVRWVPGAAQGGRTYGVTARVTDNGVPPLSASTTFRVAVRDTQGDFALRLGTTNVLRGGSASIPVDLETPLELRALRFGLSVPVTALEALQLVPIAVELGTATVVPDGPGHSRLEFTAANGATFLGAQRLAQLGFTAPAGDESVALRLAPESVEAVRVDGVVITRPRVVPGRVFVLGDAPLLDLVVRGATAEIHVYGRADLRYEVEPTAALEPGATWVSEGAHTSTGDVWVIPFTPAPSGDGYFRSRRLP